MRWDRTSHFFSHRAAHKSFQQILKSSDSSVRALPQVCATDSSFLIPTKCGHICTSWKCWDAGAQKSVVHTKCNQKTAHHITGLRAESTEGLHIAPLHHQQTSSPHYSSMHIPAVPMQTETGNLPWHYDHIPIMLLLSWISAHKISSQGQSCRLYGCWLSPSACMMAWKCRPSVPFHAPTNLPRSNQKDKETKGKQEEESMEKALFGSHK
jgi:hypothetical protein